MAKTKVAIVTGANRGLGLAITKILCKEYYGKVYLTSRSKSRGLHACEDLKALGLNPVYHQLDMKNANSIVRFLQNIEGLDEEVDILVNYSDKLFFTKTSITEYLCKPSLIEQAESIILNNYLCVLAFTESIVPLIGYGGKIVNISSSSGHLSRIPSENIRLKFASEGLTDSQLQGLVMSYLNSVRSGEDISDTWGDSPYVISKVALNALTFMLHRQLSYKGIIVNCVHPGNIFACTQDGPGNISVDDAAVLPADLALHPPCSGQFVWHEGTIVPWYGADPRGYIDGEL